MVLKLKRIGSSIYLFILVLIALLFFNLFINESNPFTERNINQSNSSPTELHPIVKERTKQLVQQAADKGIVIVITDGFRSALGPGLQIFARYENKGMAGGQRRFPGP